MHCGGGRASPYVGAGDIACVGPRGEGLLGLASSGAGSAAGTGSLAAPVAVGRCGGVRCGGVRCGGVGGFGAGCFAVGWRGGGGRKGGLGGVFLLGMPLGDVGGWRSAGCLLRSWFPASPGCLLCRGFWRLRLGPGGWGAGPLAVGWPAGRRLRGGCGSWLRCPGLAAGLPGLGAGLAGLRAGGTYPGGGQQVGGRLGFGLLLGPGPGYVPGSHGRVQGDLHAGHGLSLASSPAHHPGQPATRGPAPPRASTAPGQHRRRVRKPAPPTVARPALPGSGPRAPLPGRRWSCP